MLCADFTVLFLHYSPTTIQTRSIKTYKGIKFNLRMMLYDTMTP